MTAKAAAGSCSTHVAGAEVPEPVVLLGITAGLVALGGAGMGGVDPDLQPGAIVPHLSQCGFLALAPAVGAHVQHVVFPLLHLLGLGTQDTRSDHPGIEGQGKGVIYYTWKNEPFPCFTSTATHGQVQNLVLTLQDSAGEQFSTPTTPGQEKLCPVPGVCGSPCAVFGVTPWGTKALQSPLSIPRGVGHLRDKAMIVLHAKAMLQTTATYSPC